MACTRYACLTRELLGRLCNTGPGCVLSFGRLEQGLGPVGGQWAEAYTTGGKRLWRPRRLQLAAQTCGAGPALGCSGLREFSIWDHFRSCSEVETGVGWDPWSSGQHCTGWGLLQEVVECERTPSRREFKSPQEKITPENTPLPFPVFQPCVSLRTFVALRYTHTYICMQIILVYMHFCLIFLSIFHCGKRCIT